MYAVVNVPLCPLLAQPSPESPLADEALYGMTVEVLEQTTAHHWLVRTHYRYEGYAPAEHLLTDPDKVAAWRALAPCHTPWAMNFAPVLTMPRYPSPALLTLPRGALVDCGGAREGWARARLADGREGWVRESWMGSCRFDPGVGEAALRERICAAARHYLGTPYRWGGKSPQGIDCSGLVSMAYLLCGIAIYRDAKLMEGFPIHRIALGALRRADLLYFPGHVALCLGRGLYLHATGRTGSDGVCVNALTPGHPLYREDLAESLEAVGSWF